MMDDVKDYPPYLDYPKERKKQTNADKYFRNATDDELAARLTFIKNKILEKQPKLGKAALEADWLDWLKQEVNDG